MQFIDLKTLFTLVAFVLFLHEMEEWNIDEYHKKHYTDLKVTETKLSVRLWLFFLSAVGFIWAFVANVIPLVMVSAAFFMLLIDFVFLNGVQHVLISMKTRKYNPGLLFGGIIGLIVNVLVVVKIVVDQVMPVGLLIAFLLLVIPGIIQTIKSLKTTRMPGMLVKILEFSLELEKLMTQ
ncbi:MAG: HXXEE domain-containing protein [Anaerolineae bacterium]|nr:HXXEE domain-containing protein [Anaerolineae bacterium]